MSAQSGSTPLPTQARGVSAGTTSADATARLRLVPAPGTKASSGTFVLLLAGLLVVGLLGLLAVNTLLAQGSFATADLASKQDALTQREQQLQQQVALLQSPRALAAAATALGMVGTHNPVFIDTRTGRVLGVPQAGSRPTPTAQPSGKPTTQPTTQATTKPTTQPTTQPTGTAHPSPRPSATGTR